MVGRKRPGLEMSVSDSRGTEGMGLTDRVEGGDDGDVVRGRDPDLPRPEGLLEVPARSDRQNGSRRRRARRT